MLSGLDYGSLALRPAALLALLSELTRFASSQRGRLLPGFRRFGHPLRRRISLQCQLGNLHWRGFHPLDHQLASLHHTALTLDVWRQTVLEGKGAELAETESSALAAERASAKAFRPVDCDDSEAFAIADRGGAGRH